MTIHDTLANYDREIGDRIRQRRRELGISQTQLGESLGVTFQQIQKYERGTNRISSSSLIMIAETLQTTPAALICGVSGDVAAATPSIDLARRLLDTPQGFAIAKAVVAMAPKDRTLVTAFAGRLVEQAQAA